ncbi:MAG: lysoplasmalogenase [Bacilli bacterium]|nr:lysoplasmalogenase [Bacilli bacterium]
MINFSSPFTYIGLSLLALFFVVSIIHIGFCYKEDEKKRAITKVMCMPLLALSAVCFVPSRPLIYIGAIFGGLGDLFLLQKDKKKPLLLGIFSFMIGHILYIVQVTLLIIESKTASEGGLYWFCAIVYFFVVFGGMLSLGLFLTKKDVALSVGGGVYGAILSGDTAAAIVGLVITKSPLFIMMIVGGVIFLLSDLILVYSHFHKKIKKENVPIMVTYLIAELLIVASISLYSLSLIA